MTDTNHVTRVELAQSVEILRGEMHAMRELRAEMHAMRGELRAELHAMRDELRAEMQQLREDLNAAVSALTQRLDHHERWLAVLSTGQVLTLVVLIYLVFKLGL